ncbi:MAG: hypothetical protein GX596_06025 [Propionibacterium sp.]|nr:hypothetical protein [Propionibacterium sp.]
MSDEPREAKPRRIEPLLDALTLEEAVIAMHLVAGKPIHPRSLAYQ